MQLGLINRRVFSHPGMRRNWAQNTSQELSIKDSRVGLVLTHISYIISTKIITFEIKLYHCL